MDGSQLWKLFLDAKVAPGDLKELGFDLFWVRSAPHTQDSWRALSALGKALEIPPEFAYQAFNIDPGRTILQQLAEDYRFGRLWTAVAPSTSIYINRVAARVNIIKNAQDKNKAQAAAAPKPAPATPPAATSKVSTYVALAFSILAVNEIVKAALYRWQRRLTAVRS